MLIVFVIAFVFWLSGCSTFPTVTAPHSVAAPEISQSSAAVAHNQQILCRNGSHIYPCIITSPKTPMGAIRRPAKATSSISTRATDTTPVTAGSHAEHEAIAQQLQEITYAIGPLLAHLAEDQPNNDEPKPSHMSSGPDTIIADTETVLNTDSNPGSPDQVSPSIPDDVSPSTSAVPFPKDHSVESSRKMIPHGGGQGHAPQTSAAPSAPSHLDRSVLKRKLRVKHLASVYFPSNSAELLPSEKIVLIDLLPLIRDKQLLLVGYSDRNGDKNTNARLSYKRARAVKAFFLQSGLDPEKLFAGGRGSCCFKTEGKTPAGQQQNRRVEIYTPPTDFGLNRHL